MSERVADRPSGATFTRRVHYISGYDPRGARYYHRLYREESAKQVRHSGAVLEVGDRKRLGPQVSTWLVKGDWPGQKVETEYQFMAWDDLVRQHWDGLRRLFLRSLPVYLKYIMVGGFNRVAEASKNAFYTSVYPMLYLLACLLMALLAGGLVGWVSAAFTGFWWVGLILGLAAFFAVGKLGLRSADQIGALWLLRTCVFVVKWGTGPLPEIDRRAEEIAEHILREQRERPVDEVLIVGHSIGTIVSLRVIARLLEKQPGEAAFQRFHFVTLGQCIPYLSVMPGAEDFRRDITILARDTRIPWTDFTAPPDPLCFFKVNPIAVSGITPVPEDRPRQMVVRVFRMFAPATYAKIRKNKLRIHFQYLMASELPADYDYFAITAGPRTMRQHPIIS